MEKGSLKPELDKFWLEIRPALLLGRVIKSSPTDLGMWGTSEPLSSSVLGWAAPPAGVVCGPKAGTKMLAVGLGGLGYTAPTCGTTIQGQPRLLVGYGLVEMRASSSKRRASSAVLMRLIPKQGGHLLLKQGKKLFCDSSITLLCRF